MTSKKSLNKTLLTATAIIMLLTLYAIITTYKAHKLENLNNKQVCITDSIQSVANVQSLQIDSLTGLIKNSKQKPSLTGIIKHNINISPISLVLYEPFNLKPKLTHNRPTKTDDSFLCIPAAYTNLKNYKIKGCFIENGKLINKTILNVFKGVCIVKPNGIDILPFHKLDDKLIEDITEAGYSLFQQSLLVENFNIVHYNKFKDFKVKRRALITRDNKFYVCETVGPAYFNEFQRALINIGTKDAIYTDMGSWSEGWYRNYHGNIVKIGDNFRSTHRQTNWILLKKS